LLLKTIFPFDTAWIMELRRNYEAVEMYIRGSWLYQIQNEKYADLHTSLFIGTEVTLRRRKAAARMGENKLVQSYHYTKTCCKETNWKITG
jgi:hypothetical protein